MTPEKITIGGTAYEVAHAFSPGRLAIRFEGAIVLADFVYDAWELSGEPTTPDEAAVLAGLIGPLDVTTITETPPTEG